MPTYVETPTQYSFDRLIKLYARKGWTWCDGVKASSTNEWQRFEQKTCVRFQDCFKYNNKNWYLENKPGEFISVDEAERRLFPGKKTVTWDGEKLVVTGSHTFFNIGGWKSTDNSATPSHASYIANKLHNRTVRVTNNSIMDLNNMPVGTILKDSNDLYLRVLADLGGEGDFHLYAVSYRAYVQSIECNDLKTYGSCLTVFELKDKGLTICSPEAPVEMTMEEVNKKLGMTIKIVE